MYTGWILNWVPMSDLQNLCWNWWDSDMPLLNWRRNVFSRWRLSMNWSKWKMHKKNTVSASKIIYLRVNWTKEGSVNRIHRQNSSLFIWMEPMSPSSMMKIWILLMKRKELMNRRCWRCSPGLGTMWRSCAEVELMTIRCWSLWRITDTTEA